MKRILGAVLGGLAVSCGAAHESEELGRTEAALVTAPALSSGQLCFTSVRDFHVAVGADQPQSGWVHINEAKSAGVLGGTGVGSPSSPEPTAVSSITFAVTSLDPGLDNANYGSARRVCAEVGVQDACNLTRACWVSDGNWTVERKSNPGQESLDECGENGTTILASSDASTRLPPLLTGTLSDPVFQIALSAQGGPSPQLTAQFNRQGLNMRTLTLPVALATSEGFAGFRNERLKIALQMQGLVDPCPGVGSCATVTNNYVAASSVQPERSGFACGYYDHYTPPARQFVTGGTLPELTSFQITPGWYPNKGSCHPLVNVNWQAPQAATGLLIYQDGQQVLPVQPAVAAGETFGLSLLQGKTYTFQAVWQDAQGGLSKPATRRVTTPLGCAPQDKADGGYDVAIVLMYYPEAGAVPATRAEVENNFFGTTNTGYSSTPAQFIAEITRGTVPLRGTVFDWIPMQGTQASDCGNPQTECTFSVPLQQQAVNALHFNPANYDFVAYFVNGSHPNPSYHTPNYLDGSFVPRNGTQLNNTLVHEFLGHGMSGLWHSGGYEYGCDGTVVPGPRLDDPSGAHSLDKPNAACRFYNYGDRTDPMGASGQGYFNTQKLLQLGLMNESEVQVDEFGGTYEVKKLRAAGGIKQLRLQLFDNIFYYLEYRSGELLDRGAPGIQIRLWHPNASNFFVPFPTGATLPYSDDSEGQLLHEKPLQSGYYCDPYRKVRIDVLGLTSDGAQVKVTRGACTPPLLPTSVQVGGAFACATMGDGSVRCWGSNDHGQLGRNVAGPIGDQPGEMGAALAPVPLCATQPCPKVTQLALGYAHACALMADGSLRCWGANSLGQLGAGDRLDRVGTVVTPNVGGPVAIVTSGKYFTCAKLVAGAVKCWGQNWYGQLGVGHVQHIGDDANEMGGNLAAVAIPGPETVTKLAAGAYHVCAATYDGQVSRIRCWGLGDQSQLGFAAPGDAYGDTASELVPPVVDLGANDPAVVLSLGTNHTCVATSASQVKCWGYGSRGQLGYGDIANHGKPAGSMGSALPVVPLASDIYTLALGDGISCAKSSAGALKCWGRASTAFGQPTFFATSNDIGDSVGEVANLAPVALGIDRRLAVAKSLSTNGNTTCVLLDDSTIKCFGSNANGELGQGDTVARGGTAASLGDGLPRVLLQ